MDAIQKAQDFFETNERYNFYVYDSKNDKVGASVNNDTLEQANTGFEKIFKRLEPGKYHLKAKKTKGDDGNNGLIKMDFVVTQSSYQTSKNGQMSDEAVKLLFERAKQEAKFEMQFEQLIKDVERLKKYEPLLEKLAENQKAFIKAVQELTDNDEENDETGAKRLEGAKDTVMGIMDMFENFKK